MFRFLAALLGLLPGVIEAISKAVERRKQRKSSSPYDYIVCRNCGYETQAYRKTFKCPDCGARDWELIIKDDSL